MPTTYLWTTLSDEHNRTNMVGQGTESPNSGNGMYAVIRLLCGYNL